MMNEIDRAAIAAKAWASDDVRFVGKLGEHDLFMKGEAMFTVPSLWTGMYEGLLETVRARRYADLFGRCPRCQGVADVHLGQFAHESRCGVSDPKLRKALGMWHKKVGRFAIGSRIIETPVR